MSDPAPARPDPPVRRHVVASRATAEPITEAEAADTALTGWGPMGRAVFADLDDELRLTRRVVRAVPTGVGGHRLYEGGRTVDALLRHLASVLHWGEQILSRSSIDIDDAETGALPPDATTVEAVAAVVAATERVARAAQGVSDAALERPWSVRRGGAIGAVAARHSAFRRMAMSHLVHHRAQLMAALRDLDVEVPEAYVGL